MFFLLFSLKPNQTQLNLLISNNHAPNILSCHICIVYIHESWKFYFFAFWVYYTLLPNLYHILHITQSSSKSNNVPCMLYNYMQCAFLSHYITFLGKMTCALYATEGKMVIFLISEGKGVIPFLTFTPPSIISSLVAIDEAPSQSPPPLRKLM